MSDLPNCPCADGAHSPCWPSSHRANCAAVRPDRSPCRRRSPAAHRKTKFIQYSRSFAKLDIHTMTWKNRDYYVLDLIASLWIWRESDSVLCPRCGVRNLLSYNIHKYICASVFLLTKKDANCSLYLIIELVIVGECEVRRGDLMELTSPASPSAMSQITVFQNCFFSDAWADLLLWVKVLFELSFSHTHTQTHTDAHAHTHCLALNDSKSEGNGISIFPISTSKGLSDWIETFKTYILTKIEMSTAQLWNSREKWLEKVRNRVTRAERLLWTMKLKFCFIFRHDHLYNSWIFIFKFRRFCKKFISTLFIRKSITKTLNTLSKDAFTSLGRGKKYEYLLLKMLSKRRAQNTGSLLKPQLYFYSLCKNFNVKEYLLQLKVLLMKII